MKWVFWNKLDKEGNVIRNKARLVVKGIFLEYSLTSKSFTVLNKKCKKIEESYYVTFDVKCFKNSQQKMVVQSDEIFPSSCSQSNPLMTLYEDFQELFDELEKVISS